jgi:hypothetical protein
MPFYTKKPVTIEARQFLSDTATEVVLWCDGEGVIDEDGSVLYLDINTREGIMRANLGDYIIKGVKGEFYPCRSDIFHDTYEDISFSEDDYDPAEEYNDKRAYIKVDDIVDHDDGSATIGISMDQTSMKMFAEIGILKILTDESKRIISDNNEFDTNVGC